MNSKYNKYLTILAVTSLLLANMAMGYAENVTPQSPTVPAPLSDQTNLVTPDSTAAQSADLKAKNDQFISKVKQELDLSKSDYSSLLSTLSDTKQRLDLITEQKLSLQGQLNNLDDQVTITTTRLLTAIKQVITAENDITLLYEQIDVNQVAMEYQKNQLKDYVKTIYQDENSLLSHDTDGSIDAFKLLLTDGTVGDNVRQLHYFNILDVAGQQMVEKLDALGKSLQDEKADLEVKKANLEKLQTILSKEKAELEMQKKSKENLLKVTLGQEQVFQKLMEQTVQQQNQMVEDVKALDKALNFLQQKMAEDGASFDVDRYKSVLDFRTLQLYKFQVSNFGNVGGQLAWPVSPDRGVSAYFHDPRYVGTFGVQHNAIDIPEYQSTPIHAAADGVVYAARDNGYGYSYIIISHVGGFMTVYGHVSNILVKTGQQVTQGGIIGLSGGMPGTPGAGYMTTGPHLHFETLLNGKYVDPLDYLPLPVLTQEQIKTLPQKYQDNWTNQLIGGIRRTVVSPAVAQ